MKISTLVHAHIHVYANVRTLFLAAILTLICFANAQDSLNVRLVAHDITYNDSREIKVSGDYAYIADGINGLTIIDISNPEIPLFTSNLETTGNILCIEVLDTLAYIGDCFDGLLVINVSNPRAPEVIGHYDTPRDPLDLIIRGNYAYIADLAVHIVDISNPSEPVGVAIHTTGGEACDLYLDGDLLYIADGPFGFQILDVSDPEYPVLIFSYDPDKVITSIECTVNYAYMGTRYDGIMIWDIATPSEPSLAFDDDVTIISDIQIIHNTLYRLYNGLHIYNLSSSYTFTLEGFYSDIMYANGFCIHDDFAFIAAGSSGLYILDISHFTESISESPLDQIQPVPQTLALSAYPNPFNSAVSIELPYEASEIEIYDIKGNLCHKTSASGTTFTWQPSKELESGIYKVIVKSYEIEHSSKVIYMK